MDRVSPLDLFSKDSSETEMFLLVCLLEQFADIKSIPGQVDLFGLP